MEQNLNEKFQWNCSCGKTNHGNFCVACGTPRSKINESNSTNSGVNWWNCSCGKKNLGNFCVACGNMKDENNCPNETIPVPETGTKSEISISSLMGDIEGPGIGNVNIGKYVEIFSANELWIKISKHMKSIGLNLIYNALQLFYVTENPNCPKKVKAAIYASLGYLVAPLDIVPDFTPFLGYSDDASTVAVTLGMARMYIDESIREKARVKIEELFGSDARRSIEKK